MKPKITTHHISDDTGFFYVHYDDKSSRCVNTQPLQVGYKAFNGYRMTQSDVNAVNAWNPLIEAAIINKDAAALDRTIGGRLSMFYLMIGE